MAMTVCMAAICMAAICMAIMTILTVMATFKLLMDLMLDLFKGCNNLLMKRQVPDNSLLAESRDNFPQKR